MSIENSSEKHEDKALSQIAVSGSIFGGLDKYFEDLENYEDNLYCSECGSDDNSIFSYSRTTSNSEVWWCKNCKREESMSKKPNEDLY
jgi:hypothetical protein